MDLAYKPRLGRERAAAPVASLLLGRWHLGQVEGGFS